MSASDLALHASRHFAKPTTSFKRCCIIRSTFNSTEGQLADAPVPFAALAFPWIFAVMLFPKQRVLVHAERPKSSLSHFSNDLSRRKFRLLGFFFHPMFF
jgi:hypothetical protein